MHASRRCGTHITTCICGFALVVLTLIMAAIRFSNGKDGPHCTMMRSIATYGNEKMTEELEYLDGKGQMVYTLENLGIEEFLDIVFLTTGKV